ncbi:SAVMC3_10250 family protein [Streptomyces koyangensis]|uniref:SAVMC3_10250 family protein n=1 Tax=Streptomyces koyangensis TaxID=188770 RepID=UPI003454BC5D
MERAVREIVYLSESKLRQFVPAPRRVPRAGALRVTTPLGGIDMDAPTPDLEQGQLRHLRDVSRHVELMADWYAQPGLCPGQWVQFEAPLRCVTLGGAHQDLVLFVDPSGQWGTGSVTDEGCRLLMHGSVRHLRGWNPTSVDGPALEVEYSASSLGTAFVTRIGQIVEALTRHRDPQLLEQTSSLGAVRLHRRGVQELLEALDSGGDCIDTSALMTGYARVTGVLSSAGSTSRCVVASPLIVEYAAADSARDSV